MRQRGWWFFAGLGVGFGMVSAVALLLAMPRTRRALSDLGEVWIERVTDAVREGVRAARIREAELEGAILADEHALSSDRPDYLV